MGWTRTRCSCLHWFARSRLLARQLPESLKRRERPHPRCHGLNRWNAEPACSCIFRHRQRYLMADGNGGNTASHSAPKVHFSRRRKPERLTLLPRLLIPSAISFDRLSVIASEAKQSRVTCVCAVASGSPRRPRPPRDDDARSPERSEFLAIGIISP